MTTWQLTLSLLPGTFAVCRLAPDAPIPAWALADTFVSITRSRDELSIVCPQPNVPPGIQRERHWRCLKVEGPFDLARASGVLAALAGPLAEVGISLFVVATYDTDYLLLQDTHLERATQVLTQAGHQVRLQPML